MKKLLLILFFLTNFYIFISADETSLSLAETAYKNADYAKAQDYYAQVLKEHSSNGALFYNLGNSYYKNQEIGKAVYFYLKAQKLLPRDKDVNTNLRKARNQVLDQNETQQRFIFHMFSFMLSLISFNEFLGLLLCLFTSLNLLLLMLLLEVKSKETIKKIVPPLGIILTVLFIIFLFKINQEFIVSEGVIITNKIEVKSGPSATLATLFFLHQGVEFDIRQTTENWTEIKLENGYTGWISNDDFWKL